MTKAQKAEIQHVLRLAKEDEDERTAEGRLICAECPVRLSCLSHFFEAAPPESFDLIYGGYRMWVEDDVTHAENEYTRL